MVNAVKGRPGEIYSGERMREGKDAHVPEADSEFIIHMKTVLFLQWNKEHKVTQLSG